MPVILRIDVDESYRNRILNYARSNQELFFGIDSLGYLESCKRVVYDLNDRGIKASIFFQPLTVPNKGFARLLKEMGHSIGLHAVHTKNYNDFLNDFGKLTKYFDGKIHGFTKHGSGKLKLSRKHDNKYDFETFIAYAKQSNLKYFLGNKENPNENEQLLDGILYFPSAFWLNRNYREDVFTVDWLIEESKNRNIVVLMHPEDVIVGTALMAREYEKILDNVEFRTIEDVSEDYIYV